MATDLLVLSPLHFIGTKKLADTNTTP